MKNFWIEPEIKKINKKKIIIISVICILIVLITTTIIYYNNDKNFREWIDKNIFRKEVMQDKVATIKLKEMLNQLM